MSRERRSAAGGAAGPHQRHRVRGDRLTAADRVYTLVCFAFDADARRIDSDGLGDGGAHRVEMRLQLRRLEDDRHVHIADFVSLAGGQ